MTFPSPPVFGLVLIFNDKTEVFCLDSLGIWLLALGFRLEVNASQQIKRKEIIILIWE